MTDLERMVFAQVYALELRAGRVALAKDKQRRPLHFDDLEIGVAGPDVPTYFEDRAITVTALMRAALAVSGLRLEGPHLDTGPNGAAREVADDIKREVTTRATPAPRVPTKKGKKRS